MTYIHPATTEVAILPTGHIAYKMAAWWRELGPNGEDWGNFFHLPDGSVQLTYNTAPLGDARHEMDIESNGHTAAADDPGMCVCGDPFPHRTTLKVI